MRLTKLTATLFATSMMAMIALPEAAFGAGQTAQYHQAKTAQAKKERDSLANPAQFFAGGVAPGNMNQALTDAVADVGGAAHGLPLGTDVEKATALQVVVNSVHGADDKHKEAIRKALSLTADPSDTPKLNAFVQAMHEKLVQPGIHGAAVAAHHGAQTFINALLNMHAELTAVPAIGNLTGVISDATLAAGAMPLAGMARLAVNGAAHGMPHATMAEKIAVLRAILVAGVAHHDYQALAAVLGTKNLVELQKYCDIAEFEEVHYPAAALELNGMAGGDLVAKLTAVKTRLNTATHNAIGGAAFAAPAAVDINLALTRAGL